MTTNGVLLNKYMDFLVHNNFDLLISLDGDRKGHSYRVFHNGRESFDIVLGNIDSLYNNYPDFFKNNVKFNSVLHDRNSVKDIHSFISSRYNKKPMISELNIFGINKERLKEFKSLYHSIAKEFSQMSEEEYNLYSTHSPFLQHYEKWLFQMLMRVYSKNLSEVLSSDFKTDINNKSPEFPTNTCIPFSRKIFVSVSGKIYPCERIGNEQTFGCITDNGIDIHYDNIITSYNNTFAKYIPLCKDCKIRDFCSVCMVSDVNGVKSCMHNHPRDIKEIISFFSNNPEKLRNLMKNLIVL